MTAQDNVRLCADPRECCTARPPQTAADKNKTPAELRESQQGCGNARKADKRNLAKNTSEPEGAFAAIYLRSSGKLQRVPAADAAGKKAPAADATGKKSTASHEEAALEDVSEAAEV